MLIVKKKLVWLEKWDTLSVHDLFPSQIEPALNCHREFDRAQLSPTASVDDITELCLVFFDEIVLPWQVL